MTLRAEMLDSAVQVETWTAADAETMELDRSEDRAKLHVSIVTPKPLHETLNLDCWTVRQLSRVWDCTSMTE